LDKARLAGGTAQNLHNERNIDVIPAQLSGPAPAPVVPPRRVPIDARAAYSDSIAAVTQGIADWPGLLAHPERLAAFVAPSLDAPASVASIRSALSRLLDSLGLHPAARLAASLERDKRSLAYWQAFGPLGAERAAHYEARTAMLSERLAAEGADPLAPLRQALTAALERLDASPAFAAYVVAEAAAFQAAFPCN
jgi:hypothetical protein